MTLPDVILLNGPSSAGKSSLTLALQAQSPAPYIRMGLDEFIFERSPTRWFGAEEGLRFVPRADGLVDVEYGDEVRKLHRAFHRSARLCVEEGLRIVVDEVILTREVLDDWVAVMAGIDVFFVGIHCTPEELTLRENARRDRTRGTAVPQIERVHAHGIYDLEIDSTATPSSQLAAQILAAIETRSGLGAFKRLR